jgi:ribosome-associated toxin RatA of RatAB toxin-antitoxin module
MRTVDRLRVRAPADRVFQAAMDVEQWPSLLSHYRWVRFLERRTNGGLVEMAAWRPFGPFNYPTWWVSEMWIDRAEGTVRYRHVRGITKGMDVEWRIDPIEGGTDMSIVHDWVGPVWPVVGGLAAELVIGPVFIHGIASRTLAGIAKHVEISGTERAAVRP